MSGLGDAPSQSNKRLVGGDIRCVKYNILDADSKGELASTVRGRISAVEQNAIAGEADGGF